MTKNPLISIIVPVYKAEQYLHKCVESLLAQTFSDFEILLIDDGSPDNSGKICDEYSAADHRIKTFHKDNGGVSSARQFGIDHAVGEYTIHADPDDWVEPNMLHDLYEKAVEDDADMVICDYYVNYPDRQLYLKQEPSNLDSETVARELFGKLHGSCWNKLIRRSCYEKYHVSFPPKMHFCEDLCVIVSLLRHPIKVSYLGKAYYHYEQTVNPLSLVRNNTTDYYEVVKRQLQQVVTPDFYENYVVPHWTLREMVNLLKNHQVSGKEYRKKVRENAHCLIHLFPKNKMTISAIFISYFGLKNIICKIYERKFK